MFPHVPLQAITLDLADTHSVSLTVDRILSDSIYIPEGGVADNTGAEEEGTPPPTSNAEAGDDSPAHHPTPRHSQEPLPFSSSVQPDTPPVESVSIQDSQPLESHDIGGHELSHDKSCDHDNASVREVDISQGPNSSDGDSGVRRRHATQIRGNDPQASNDTGSTREWESDVPGMELGPSVLAGEEGRIRPARAIMSGDKSLSVGSDLSTASSDTYSRLFSSLQERKAELLRKARR